ncbi:MAG: zinc-binding dehydrogenase [Anaerolineae bacterium]|nr:zinc-binding dehydrogenase [Anaerolineae bacterium]
MKAVQLVEPGKPLELREVPMPVVGAGDVLVQVKAAGICHSDAHYRSGLSRVEPLPMTLGHEVAGVVAEVGTAVSRLKPGDSVCIHYMTTCGDCEYCNQATEQFCTSGQMIGKYRDGGYADYIVVPARSAFVLPDEIPFAHGAVMMCSSSTSLHALMKTRMKPGETVAVFGAGGLGMAAIQLAYALGAATVYAVDIKEDKLALAETFGAVPINAAGQNPVDAIADLTNGRGVNVALELIGLPATMLQAVQSLSILGRAGIVGLSAQTFSITPYTELLNKEAEIIGVSDHLAEEMPLLIDLVRRGKLDLRHVVTELVALEADSINHVLDRLDQFGKGVRAVIQPDSSK